MTETASFVASVEAAREHFLRPEMGAVGETRDYLEDDIRVSEAEQVAELVARFSRAELEEKALGRTIGGGIVKPIGSQLHRALHKASQETRAGVRRAVERTIARTYASSMGLDPANDAHVDKGRTPDQIWAFWIPRIYSGYLRKSSGLVERDLDAIEAFGADALREELADLDLGRKARGRKIDLIGVGYGHAGTVLRLGQSSMTPDAWVTNPSTSQLLYRNLWPMSDCLP